MGDKFSTVNIRLYLSPEQSAQEENDLRELLFGYSCPVNKDVEMYLREQAIFKYKRGTAGLFHNSG